MNHYTVDCLDLCKSAGINCVQIKNYQDKLMHYDLHVYAFSMTGWFLSVHKMATEILISEIYNINTYYNFQTI